MLRKLFTISILLFLSSMLFAQQNALLRADGDVVKMKAYDNVEEALKDVNVKAGIKAQATTFLRKTNAAEDTMRYMGPGEGDVRFGYDPGDVMIQWFVAPTDLDIRAIGFYTNDVVSEAAAAEVKIVKLAWDEATLKSFDAATWLGWYEGSGEHGIAALMDDLDVTGDWVDIAGNAATSPFGEDLWSDDGLGAPVIPENGADVWVSMDLLGFNPSVVKGEIFGVVLKNVSPAGAENLLRCEALTAGPAPGFKFYKNGRLDTDPTSDGFDPGWWIRTNYTWNMAVAVTYTGDTPPVIDGVTEISTTISTDAQTVEATVTDDNPAGGDMGVASVVLQYSLDGGDFVDVAMSASGDVYSADIPGQSPGTTIVYRLVATDVNGNVTTTVDYSYFIFQHTANTLVLFNGTDVIDGYPNAYYFGVGDFAAYSVADFPHDRWAYGAASGELFDLYDNIIEITANGAGPAYLYNDVIAAWLEADANRNYLLVGDEWLGVQSGWVNMAHEAGSFHYDVLGMTFEYNDVNFDGADVTTPSLVMPVEGSALGGALYDLWQASAGADSMLYDPAGEITGSNYLDGADVLDDVEVDMKGVGLDGTEYNIGFHRELAAGNKVAVLLYDALSLNSAPEYVWFGFTSEAPQVQALGWFDVAIDVEDEQLTPDEFGLAQNYPNPFNPTTTINFSLSSKSSVSLKVYNLLGQEVMTLVDGVQNAGVHEVNFDAGQLSSGVYFYTIKAGDFVSTKKMMLLK